MVFDSFFEFPRLRNPWKLNCLNTDVASNQACMSCAILYQRIFQKKIQLPQPQLVYVMWYNMLDFEYHLFSSMSPSDHDMKNSWQYITCGSISYKCNLGRKTSFLHMFLTYWSMSTNMYGTVQCIILLLTVCLCGSGGWALYCGNYSFMGCMVWTLMLMLFFFISS